MDANLEERLRLANDRSEQLEIEERKYLTLEAHEKVLFAQLYAFTSGTVAERESKVYSSQDWIGFSRGLAEAKSRTNESKRQWELALKSFDGEYLSFKIQNESIKRAR